MISRLGNDVLTILRGGQVRDNFGDTSGTATETTVPGCSVQPGSAVEQTDRGDLIVTTLTAYLPAAADITATDQVRYGGVVYAVDGEPARWADSLGAADHVQAVLKLTEGSD